MATSDDARSSPRHVFPSKQLVAAVVDGKMPSVTDFSRVPCEDVSRSGIAVYLKDEPEVDEYVVGLGKSPDLSYVCARVVHTRQAVHTGQMRYRVGFQFTGRAHLDRSTLTMVRMSDDSATSDAFP